MKILLIGGDERTISLNEILNSNNFETQTLFINSNSTIIKNINEFDSIFLPIPSDRNGFLNSPFLKEKIKFEIVCDLIKNFKGKIIGGFLPESEKILKNLKLNILNILKDEKFTLINAIITSEGAIEKLINESKQSLFESKICITGYGRVSRALSQRLRAFTSELIVYNNPSINFVNAQIDNIKIKPLSKFKEECKNFNIIVNTIPSLIITKDILTSLNKETLILDLSSLPGGVDFNFAKQIPIKTIHYLGIPSKVSSYSSANAIFNCVNNFLKS